jgi:hypothetical protein
MMVLPTERKKAQIKSPRELVIFSKPKVGKTSLIAALDNCLILDLESGTDYYEAMSVKIKNMSDLKNVGDAILKHKEETGDYPYKYIAVDTITVLEDMCIDYAEQMYAATAQGKNWYVKGKPEYGNILGMPQGAGYRWLRLAYDKVIEYISSLAPRIILLGHVKDTHLEKNGVEVDVLELDLTGKIKRTTAADSDAIGYLYRGKDGNYISFKTKDEVICGSRSKHLENKEILISKVDSDGNFLTMWDEIYID